MTSGLINREMTKTGQATGLSGSHPLGYIITYLENRFVPYCMLRNETVVDIATVGGDIFGTLKLNEWSVLCRPGCKMLLLNPSVFISRDTLIER